VSCAQCVLQNPDDVGSATVVWFEENRWAKAWIIMNWKLNAQLLAKLT
jgi:hypothetical protein